MQPEMSMNPNAVIAGLCPHPIDPLVNTLPSPRFRAWVESMIPTTVNGSYGPRL